MTEAGSFLEKVVANEEKHRQGDRCWTGSRSVSSFSSTDYTVGLVYHCHVIMVLLIT